MTTHETFSEQGDDGCTFFRYGVQSGRQRRFRFCTISTTRFLITCSFFTSMLLLLTVTHPLERSEDRGTGGSAPSNDEHRSPLRPLAERLAWKREDGCRLHGQNKHQQEPIVRSRGHRQNDTSHYRLWFYTPKTAPLPLQGRRKNTKHHALHAESLSVLSQSPSPPARLLYSILFLPSSALR